MSYSYKHTQMSYMMLIVMLAVLVLFARLHMTARAELPSEDAGTNLLVTSIMVAILLVLTSFVWLHVWIDGTYLRIKFGKGIFQKKFLLSDIVSATRVKNHRWYGRGIRVWFWPYMWIYNVAGLDAVELQMKNGRIYRIGTDEPEKLAQAILAELKK